MALLKASGADTYLEIGTANEAKIQGFNYTGGARNNQLGATTASFVVAAIGSTQQFTVDARDVIRTGVGATLQIADGSHTIIALVISQTGTTVVAQTVAITAGSAGNTMASAAVVTPVTNGTFVVAAVGSTQVVPMGSAAQAAIFLVGDIMTITGSADTLIGLVTAQGGKNVTVQTTTLSVGSAGDTMSTNATITLASGDRIAYSKVPANVILFEETLICDSVNSGMTVSSGFFSLDGTETNNLACLIAAATALATATRIRDNTAVQPQKTDKDSYFCVTIGGGAMSATTNLTPVLKSKFPGNP